MKGKTKKIIAGIATLAMAAQLAFVIPASAATGDVTTIMDVPLTATTMPAVEGVTWGSDVAGLITANSGLLLGNANSTGNNYTDKPFVTFDTAKGKDTDKISISYNVAYQDTAKKSKGQAYTNYIMSYYNDGGQFLFSLTESIGEWNDKATLTYATEADKTASVDLAHHIDGSVNAELSYDADGNAYVSIDGGTYNVYPGTSNGIKDIKLSVSGGQDFNRGVFIKNYKMTSTEVVPVALRTVKFDVDGNKSTAVVNKGESVASADVPDTAKKGYLFKGWSTDGSSEYDASKTYTTTEEVLAMTVDNNLEFTAVYTLDPDYVQSIAKVEFVDSEGNAINPKSVKAQKFPTEAEAVEYRPYEIKVTSDIGQDITADCDITWSAVGGGGLDANYFTFVDKKAEDEAVVKNKRYARVRQGGESWFGYIKAEATYPMAEDDGSEVVVPTGISSKDGVVTVKNDTAHAELSSATLICATYDDKNTLTNVKTYPLTFTEGVATQNITDMADGSKLMVWSSVDGEGAMVPIYETANFAVDATTSGSAQIPCAVLANAETTQIMPQAGYPTSMDYYVDELVGYKGTSDDYSEGYDPVLNNWCIVGSNGGRDMELVKGEDGKKAIKFSATGGNRGGSGSSCVGTYPFPQQSQQYVLESIVKFESTGRMGVYDKTPNNTSVTTEWSVSYDSGVLTVGDETITGVDANKWHKLIVTSDPVNHLYSVYVYNETGDTLIGSVTNAAGGGAGKFLCFDSGFPVYVNSIKAYIPTVNTVSLASDIEVVRIPDAGQPANTVALTANCEDENGIKLTGAVDWTLAEKYEGVELVKGTQTATLKVLNGASGTVEVRASMGGKTATKEITLTTSANIVAFKTKSSSITIPFAGGEAATAQYRADTVTPENPEGINDTNITYSFLAKNGTDVLSTLPAGITSSTDETTNTMTISVAAGATPTIFYIKATNSEGLAAKTQVNVHGLSYTFGTTEVEGETQVTSASLYTETLGYGFESTTGLTDNATNVAGSAAYKFKANVPNGNYKVTVSTTSESMTSEIVENLPGETAVIGTTKSGGEFNVAVCDGVLDLTFAANSNVSSLSIAQIARPEEREKPKVYATGDSTTQNSSNGALSWGSYTANNPSIVPDVFSSFSNNGKSGADSESFYTSSLIENILLDIHPGDYVTVNMGINYNRVGNNEAAAYPTLMDTYYVKAIMDRGGIPVITTSTPIGYNSDPNKGWTENSDGTITCNRGTAARNGELRKLAQKYDLNIIELSYYCENYFNNEITDADVATYNATNGTSFATKIEMLRSWWADHNHYKEPVSKIIAPYMLDCLSQIEGGSEAFNQASDPHINEQ